MPSSVVRSDRICHFQQVTCQPIWHQRVCVCCVWRRKCCVVLSAALRFNFCANRFDRSFMCLPLHTQMIWFDMMWHWHTLAVNCQPIPYSLSLSISVSVSRPPRTTACAMWNSDFNYCWSEWKMSCRPAAHTGCWCAWHAHRTQLLPLLLLMLLLTIGQIVLQSTVARNTR